MTTITDRIWNVIGRLDMIGGDEFILERAKLLQRLREAVMLLDKGWPGSQEIEPVIQQYGDVRVVPTCPTPGVEWVAADWSEDWPKDDTGGY